MITDYRPVDQQTDDLDQLFDLFDAAIQSKDMWNANIYYNRIQQQINDE